MMMATTTIKKRSLDTGWSSNRPQTDLLRGHSNFPSNIFVVKTSANGFKICFNIHSILSKSNVETVCYPLSIVLKHVKTKLKGCQKSLKGFKLCFSILWTFLLFSKC